MWIFERLLSLTNGRHYSFNPLSLWCLAMEATGMYPKGWLHSVRKGMTSNLGLFPPEVLSHSSGSRLSSQEDTQSTHRTWWDPCLKYPVGETMSVNIPAQSNLCRIPAPYPRLHDLKKQLATWRNQVSSFYNSYPKKNLGNNKYCFKAPNLDNFLCSSHKYFGPFWSNFPSAKVSEDPTTIKTHFTLVNRDFSSPGYYNFS